MKKPAVNCFANIKLNFLDEAREEMKKRLSQMEYYFAISLKAGGKVIGEIDACPETDEPHGDENGVQYAILKKSGTESSPTNHLQSKIPPVEHLWMFNGR